MSFPLEGPMPIIDLTAGATIVLDAVDPTTGAVVTGVTFSSGMLYAESKDHSADDAPIASMFLLPTGD